MWGDRRVNDLQNKSDHNANLQELNLENSDTPVVSIPFQFLILMKLVTKKPSGFKLKVTKIDYSYKIAKILCGLVEYFEYTRGRL